MSNTEIPRRVTLSAALDQGWLPIFAEVWGPDGSSSWRDYGDEPLSATYLECLRSIAESRDWHPDTAVWVNPAPVRQPTGSTNASTPRLRTPLEDGPQVSQQMGFLGYYMSLLEPGADVRPASLIAGRGGRVGATSVEQQEETLGRQREWWAGLTAEKRSIYRLQDVARRRRFNRGEAQVLDHDLRQGVLEALGAGVPVSTIAQSTDLTPARIYQLRDGRR